MFENLKCPKCGKRAPMAQLFFVFMDKDNQYCRACQTRLKITNERQGTGLALAIAGAYYAQTSAHEALVFCLVALGLTLFSILNFKIVPSEEAKSPD